VEILWVLVPVVAHADMSECINIADQNKKNYCMASYSGSAAFCDKIKVTNIEHSACEWLLSNNEKPPTKPLNHPQRKKQNEPTTSSS
jgi:hypothetical protein